MSRNPLWLVVLGASLLLGGCVTEEVGPANPGSGSTDDTIKDRIAAFETLVPGKEYDDNLSILSKLLKERSYPFLVEALQSNPSPRVRGAVALCLGLGQDDRARDHLVRASTKDENAGVRYTAAYCLCLYRDSRGLPVLFEALKADNPQIRWDANDRLKRLVRMDFGFEATGSPAERAAAVGRWEGWYKEVGPGGASMALMPPGGVPK